MSDDLRGVSKHNAGAVVISQDRSDLSGEPRSAYGASAKLTGMASLFPVRMVFRQPRSMVERALRWLGVDPTSERVEQVMNLPVGHCLLRDQESRVGEVTVRPLGSDLAQLISHPLALRSLSGRWGVQHPTVGVQSVQPASQTQGREMPVIHFAVVAYLLYDLIESIGW